MEIVEITAKDDRGYKRFFTAGLERHDDCFRISPADEANDPFPTKGTPDSFTLAAVTDAGELMYVASEYAGRGVGGALIEGIVRRAKNLPTIEQVNLTVLAGNERAKGLYFKYGFRVYGVEKNSVKSGGRYYDEELMAHFLI